MNRSAFAAAAALPLLHAAVLLAPGPPVLKLALVVAADAIAAFVFALRLRKPRGGPPLVAEAAAEAVPLVGVDAASLESREDALRQAAEIAGLIGRLGEIRALAKDCAESGAAILEERLQLRSAGTGVAELSETLSAARRDSDLIRENTDKIFEIANNLANSAEKAFNLSREVEARAASMAGELAASLSETAGLLEESKRISDILTIMSSISSTTSILSFNASIVAANAGAHGKAFAVVAKEMRKLSESTETSLKNITSIVLTIQDKVKAVSDRIRSVNDGVQDEKESLVAVAGDLQGVMLANEVVRTISGLCVQKSVEELECLRSMMGKVESAARALEARVAPERIEDFSSALRRVVDIAGN